MKGQNDFRFAAGLEQLKCQKEQVRKICFQRTQLELVLNTRTHTFLKSL